MYAVGKSTGGRVLLIVRNTISVLRKEIVKQVIGFPEGKELK